MVERIAMPRTPATLLITLFVGLVLSGCGSSPTDDEDEGPVPGDIVALFGVQDDVPALIIGYGAELDLSVPPGDYSFVLSLGDDLVWQFASDFLDGPVHRVGTIPSDGTVGERDPEFAAAIATLADFASDVELARLDVLSMASEGFTRPLFDPAVSYGADTSERLFAAYESVASHEAAVTSALVVVEERLSVLAPQKYVSVGGGIQRFLTDRLRSALDVFNLQALIERERARVLRTIEHVPPGTEVDVFNALSPVEKGDATSYADWVAAIRRGDRDNQIGAVHSTLHAVALEARVVAGTTPGQVVTDEAPALIEAGIDLQVQALGKAPHIGKAIDVTNKAREWEGYVRRVYQDPAGGIDALLKGPYQDFVKGKIADDLRQAMPDAPQKVIDTLAGQLARSIAAGVSPGQAIAPRSPGSDTAVSEPPRGEPEPSNTPEVEAGWVDSMVEAIAQELLERGLTGIEVAVATDDLRLCLLDADAAGLSPTEALSACAFIIEQSSPEPGDDPTPEPPVPTLTPCAAEATIEDLVRCSGGEEPPPPPPTTAPPPTAAPPTPKPTCAAFDPACSLAEP
jgi:hypothetical protein